jgi:glycosyltransferase involved in cell wall biosynthesis
VGAMRIGIISSTTFPASLPDDTAARQGYGSESYVAILAKALSKEHEIEWFAPLGSSRLAEGSDLMTLNHNHPIQNSKGQLLADERLESISLETPKFDQKHLYNLDFIIDGSKQSHDIEELYYYNKFRHFCCMRTGFNDHIFPWRIMDQADKHLVTHCSVFADYIEQKSGIRPSVVHFGIPSFWHPFSENDRRTHFFFSEKYFLYSHRMNRQKGIHYIPRLAKDFPNETFVIQTATPLQDHKKEMQAFREQTRDQQNIRIIDLFEDGHYQYKRRDLLWGAKCMLSPFLDKFTEGSTEPYLDTGGLVSQEAIACGTPVICTRSTASEEILGHQEDKGVVFVDGYDGLKLAIKHWEPMKPAPIKWTVSNYVAEMMEVIKKY